MKKKIAVLALIIGTILLIDAFIPQSLSKFFDVSVVAEGSEYQSEFTEVNNKQYHVYSFVEKDAPDAGEDVFTITVIERKGILKNKETMVSSFEMPADRVLKPQYENMVNVPKCEIKKHSVRCGLVYCDIVPLDCKEVTVNGNQAQLQRITVELNGKKADFKLFHYCVKEPDQLEKRADIIAVDNSNEQHFCF